MTDTTTGERFRNEWPLWVAGALLVVAAQAALATTATGIGPFDVILSVMVLIRLVFQSGTPTGVTLPSGGEFIAWWIGYALIGAVLWVGVWLVARKLFGAKQRDGLSTGRAITKRVGTGKLLTGMTPFAYLGRTPIVARAEDTALVIAAPRMGKTARIAIKRITDAPAACVVTGTKPDVLRTTAKIRADKGTVHVFDPEGVSMWPDTTSWDIVAGCQDEEEAVARAKAIVNARPMKGGGNSEFFTEAADTVLRCLLHAAALGGRNMRDVLAWTRDFSDDTPYEILSTHPGAMPGWVDDLRKFCRAKAEETVASTDMTLGLALKAFGTRSVLDAVCPRRGALTFDPAGFWSTSDTIYLLTQSGETSICAPVITALVASIERAARKQSTRTVEGRLDPPMTLVLDEVANVAPIPSLPSLMTDGGGRGILPWVIAQTRDQLRQRWGKEGAGTIIESATALIVLGGSKDADFAEDMSRLIGDRLVERQSSTRSGSGLSDTTSWTNERIMPGSEIRKIPEGQGLLLYRELAAAVVKLPGWWETDARKACEASNQWTLQREGLLPSTVETAA